MIIYYTYTVISTVLTIFKNFFSIFHDNMLRQGKTPFECLYRWKNRPYRKILHSLLQWRYVKQFSKHFFPNSIVLRTRRYMYASRTYF